jgi:hypothetical protein
VRRDAKASSAASSRHQGTLAALALLLALLFVTASNAYGATATLHPSLFAFDGEGTPAGSISPQAIAVDQGSGEIYVLDDANGVVVKFDSSGAYLAQIEGSATPSGSFAFSDGSTVANAIAIDESGGANDGSLYVADPGHGVIDVFDPSGAYQGRLIGSAIPSGPFGKPVGLALDEAGSLYVADQAKSLIYKYSPAANPPLEGDYETTFSDPHLNAPAGLAFDLSGVPHPNFGDFYVVNYRGGGAPELDRYDAAGNWEATIDASGQGTALALDQASGEIYADNGSGVAQYAGDGTQVGVFGAGILADSTGLALDSSANLYAADHANANVQVFGPALEVDTPTATIEAVTDIASQAATFHGKVNPHGSGASNEASYHFEVSLDGAYWVSLEAVHSPISGTLDVDVEDEVAGNNGIAGSLDPEDLDEDGQENEFGLKPGKHYHVRLVATNAASEPTGGPTISGEVEFDTDPIAPTIQSTTSTSEVSQTEARIHATVSPHGAATSFHVEYGADASYGQRAPLAEAEVGAGVKPLAVSQALSGLSPGTVYHYRILAVNSAGTSEGADHTFKTKATPLEAPDTCTNAAIRAAQGAQSVGDCRAFEMVSPVEKNGADILGDPEYTRAADDGDAVQFSSVSGFADTPGSGLFFSYIGVRTPEGWRTHSLMPPQDAQNSANVTTSLVPVYGGFSADLSKGVFRALTPLTDDPLVAHTRNLYLREGLLSSATPTDRLLTATEVPLPPFGTVPNEQSYRPSFAAASAGFSHLIFGSTMSLTAGANSTVGDFIKRKPKLYEWVNGTVRLAGILPDGEPARCPDEGEGEEACSSAGGLFDYKDQRISRDGSQIYFSSPIDVQGYETPETQLYMRLDGTSTVRLSASERAPADPQQGAEFAGASADGHYVFFLSAQRLTDDAGGGGQDLYRYDTSLPDGDPHNLTLVAKSRNGNSVTGLIGVGDDGNYAYFLARGGQGAVGEPASLGNKIGIYVTHEGVTRFVGSVGSSDADRMIAKAGYAINQRQSRVNPGGQALTFQATEGEGLTGYDHGQCRPGQSGQSGCDEIYVYDATANGGAGELSCASCNPSGATAQRDADYAIKFATGNLPRTSHVDRALSDDGRRLFFMTRERLLPEDRNGNIQDVYEYDVPSQTLHLISTGTSSSDSYLADASATGDDVFFITRDRLAGQDIDNAYDMYDARVDGGFPVPPPKQICEGDACLVSPSPPNDPTPASSAFNGAGNAAPTRPKARCAKGSKRGKHKGKARRCVKPRKNRADDDRRTSK